MASPSRLPSVRRAGASGKTRPMSMIDGPMRNFGHLAETEKHSKRRSLLPTFSRKPSGEEVPQIKEDGEENGWNSSAASASNMEAKPRKAMDEPNRRPLPPASKLGRPTSVSGSRDLGRRPSTRSRTNTDARAGALAALEGSESSASARTGFPPSIPKRTTSARPQSVVPRGLPRTTIARPGEPARSRNNSTSTVTRTSTSASEKRTSGSKQVPPSTDEPARTQASTPPSPPSPASSTTSRSAQAASQNSKKSQMLPPPRPAFNTYQQHYSPAKSALPKPPVPSARHTRSATVHEVEEPITFEDAKQQIELLQLSLLHRRAIETLQEYDASAKRTLGKKQAKLRKEYDAIQALEREHHRILNLAALEAWCPDTALLSEHLQILSKVHSEVSALAESGSRYADLVSVFEGWIDTADLGMQGSRPGFLDSLPQDWHKAHTSLALRLRALQRDLELLPPARPSDQGPPSSLERLLVSSEQLLDGMLKELEMMTKLERGLLGREKGRLEEEVKAIDPASMVRSRDWIPAWQSVA